MENLFKTDGIRGLSQIEITPMMFFNIGVLLGTKSSTPIAVARDTRESSSLYYMMIVSGIRSLGIDVYDLGVATTPALAYMTKFMSLDFGLMITASHNPYRYNGLKVLNKEGLKISRELQEEISFLLTKNNHEYIKSVKIGKLVDRSADLNQYLDHLIKDVDLSSLSELQIVLDLANGAAQVLGKTLIKKIGLNSVKFIGDFPDGKNINEGVGTLEINHLQEIVRSENCVLGFALDGDGDRLVMVDKNLKLDGDLIAYCLITNDKNNYEKGVVITPNTNGGVVKSLKSMGISVYQSNVGDENVMMKMKEVDAVIGFEPSGHLLFPDQTSDGLFTMIKLLQLYQLNQHCFTKQKNLKILKTIKLNLKIDGIERVIKRYNEMGIEGKLLEIIKKDGRVLLRPSGTEKTLRLLLEGYSIHRLHSALKYFNAFLEDAQCAG